MRATLRTIAAGVRGRRLQVGVIGVVALLAAAAGTIALSILVETQAPFQRAFAAANGAHLVVRFAPDTTDAQLAATRDAAAVIEIAGPFDVADSALARVGGGPLEPGEVAARSDPASGVDRVTLVDGRWWRADGELVIDERTASITGVTLGQSVNFFDTGSPATPGSESAGGGPKPVEPGLKRELSPILTATVVGIARSVSTPQTIAWTSPASVTTLAGTAGPDRQLLYRVTPSATAADIGAAAAQVGSLVPSGSVRASHTWLEAMADVDQVAKLYVPVLIAFSVFALLAAAFAIANVVGGIVLTRYREIGIQKALGFTPSQVTVGLLAQVLLPATAGAVAGVAIGIAASRPAVEDALASFGLPGAFTASPEVICGVLAVTLGVCLAAAIVPAVRAGRLRTVEALAGRSPGPGGSARRVRRVVGRLPLGLPARLGIASGLARPITAAMLIGAITVGVAAATFAIGLDASLVRVVAIADRAEASPVRAHRFGGDADVAATEALIAGTPGTDRMTGLGQTDVEVAALGRVPFVGYDGDASWIGYQLVAGRWLAGPGEAVATTNVFARTGLAVGDQLTLARDGRSVRVTLVGEVFDVEGQNEGNLGIRGDWADVRAVDPGAELSAWELRPADGVEPSAYAEALLTAAGNALAIELVDDDDQFDASFALFLSVVASLATALVVVSITGVFSTVLLETRRRSRELAILRAFGATPAQIVTMVVASVVPVGLIGGAIGVPVGLAVQRAVLGYMGEVAAQTRLPEAVFDVVPPIALAGLVLAGLAIAAVGALTPGRRAASAPVAPILQTE
jgi:putative ABC transport system permease protein